MRMEARCPWNHTDDDAVGLWVAWISIAVDDKLASF